jgi:hypothetical protein
MNAIFPTVLKRLYRKEPISSFIIMVGAVDAILGGVNEILVLQSAIAGGVSSKLNPNTTKNPSNYICPLNLNVLPYPISAIGASQRYKLLVTGYCYLIDLSPYISHP